MPSLKDRVAKVSNLIKALLVVIGLLPGIAVLTGMIDIPPSLAQLVRFLSIFVCLVTLLLILLATGWLQRARKVVIAAVVVLMVVGGIGCAGSYLVFASRHLVVIESSPGQVERYVVPLNPSANIQRLMIPYRDDYVEALQTSIRKAQLSQFMEAESGSAIVLMILLLLAAQALLVGGVVTGGWKLALGDEASLNPQPLPPEETPKAPSK